MSNSKYYILYPNDKVSYKYKNDFSKFDVKYSETPSEYDISGISNDFLLVGKKILPNLSIRSKNLKNIVYFNEETENLINEFAIKNFKEVKSFLKELSSKYKFPLLSTEESTQFSKDLATFYLLFAYHRNLALICDTLTKDLKDEQYIKDTLIPRIMDLNEINKRLFKIPFLVIEEEILKCKKQKELKSYLLPYHNNLLKAVNEFTQQIKYSISSYIDIKRKITCPITENIFHLVWYIFISYVVSNVKPSKIGLCIYCGKLRKYSTNMGAKCSRCTNKGRTQR